MEAKEFKNVEAVDRYGETVVLFEVHENMAITDKGLYHVTKLFIGGKSLQTLLNEEA